MPRGDGTGPAGMGPMTGRAAGYCAGYSTPGFANPVPRMGMGFRRGAGYYGRGAGFGGGRGRGRGYGNFGRGVGFRSVTTPFANAPYRPPVNRTYGFGGVPPGAQFTQQANQVQTQPVQTPVQTAVQTTQTQTPPQPSRDQEIDMLENQLEALEEQIEQITDRINQLRG